MSDKKAHDHDRIRRWHHDVRNIVVGTVIIVAGAAFTYYLGFDRNGTPPPTTSTCASWVACNPGPGTSYGLTVASYLLCPTFSEYSTTVCSNQTTVSRLNVVCTFPGAMETNATQTIHDKNWDFVTQDGGSWIPDEFVNTLGNDKEPPIGVPRCVQPR